MASPRSSKRRSITRSRRRGPGRRKRDRVCGWSSADRMNSRFHVAHMHRGIPVSDSASERSKLDPTRLAHRKTGCGGMRNFCFEYEDTPKTR